MKILAAAASAALLLGLPGAAVAQPAAAASVPPELKPRAVAAVALNAKNPDAQKAWYTDKLGMHLVRTMSEGGKPFEYLMGFDGPAGSALIALFFASDRPSGPNPFGRVILAVPNAKALFAYLQTQGVAGREMIPGVAYFITDPEGNTLELYTAPPAPAG